MRIPSEVRLAMMIMLGSIMTIIVTTTVISLVQGSEPPMWLTRPMVVTGTIITIVLALQYWQDQRGA